MSDYTFKHWLEYADFGLEVNSQNNKKTVRDDDEGEGPLHVLNIEYLTNVLKRNSIGSKWMVPNNFFGELQWGQQNGALRCSFGPDKARATIRKLTHDLEGNPVWICKKVLEIKNLYDENPDTLAVMLQDTLNEMDQQGLDAGQADYKDMQRLVIRLASKLRSRTSQQIFMYEGIRMIEENKEYIIHWGVTGMGRQARGQFRVDQFAVHCKYESKSGLIHVTGTRIGGKLASYKWEYNQPSDFKESFVPGQGEEEIAHAVLVLFNTY